MQVIQLYEMIIVRHGLMVVGLPFSAKSSALAVLAGALGDLAAEGKIGALFNPVDMRIINPKAVTMGQLYGETDKGHPRMEGGLLLVSHEPCVDDVIHEVQVV